MAERTPLERFRLLTEHCRRCHDTVRLGNCAECPITEERRRARRGWAWSDEQERRFDAATAARSRAASDREEP